MARVLIVCDQERITRKHGRFRQASAHLYGLAQTGDWAGSQVETCETIADGITRLTDADAPDLVIADLDMPDVDRLLAWMSSRFPDESAAPIVLLAAPPGDYSFSFDPKRLQEYHVTEFLWHMIITYNANPTDFRVTLRRVQAHRTRVRMAPSEPLTTYQE